MEEALSFLQSVKKEFACGEIDLRTYSPLTLAFIGDCVYDMVIRTVIVCRANRSPADLHKIKSSVVKAAAQANFMDVVMEELTEEEQAVYKRGRNAKSYTTAKNASVIDYRKATGMEALIGYLYLQDNLERILYLVKLGLEKMEMDI